jgi:pimeloyl-ACP methyl ester carboxylesterase
MLCANGVELAYDEFGDASAPAILLIAGLGTQMIRWTSQFCERLVGAASASFGSTTAIPANRRTSGKRRHRIWRR